LDLNSNELTTLPNSIGKLTNLQTLDLNSNQLMTLPSSINSLSKLKEAKCCGEKRDTNNETPLQFLNRVLELK
jgi:Leucine-rich repeat (LRR) protein